MTLPDLAVPMSYENILKANIAKAKELLPDYTPAQGDDIMIVLQDFSYREMLLREFINEQVRGNFVMTAEGAKLDHLAMTLYGLERLKGAKPTTTATFTLSRALPYDVTIPKGYELLEDGGIYRAHTTEEAVIHSGKTSVTATVELDAFVSSSKARCEIPVEQIPYLSVHQNGDFANGGDMESDEEFRERIRVSLSRTSTAGSRNAYIGYTYAADERISDVSAYRTAPGEVKVVYWADQMDGVMQQRVERTLNAEDVRPLTDHLTIQPATIKTVDVTATLIIPKGSDAAKLTAAAREAVEGLFANPQIGRDVVTSRVIAALASVGVDDVTLAAPASNVVVGDNEIALLGAVNISTQESGDVY